mgnify:CR=1 FL=1
MNEKPVALAHEAIHETVEKILQNEPRGTILDVPSGEGALALRLKNLGFSVSCADLYPQIFKLEELENRQGNLDAELPFSNNSFSSLKPHKTPIAVIFAFFAVCISIFVSPIK